MDDEPKLLSPVSIPTGSHGVTGAIPTPPPQEVWVVRIVSERMGDEGYIFEVLNGDPGDDYAERLTDGMHILRTIDRGSWVEVTKHYVRTPIPRRS